VSGYDVGRREALRRMAVSGLTAASLPAWAEALLERAELHRHDSAAAEPDPNWKPRFLDPDEDRTLTLVSELIIPETDTPGATAAHVNRFIDAVLADAPESERREFVRGLGALDGRSRERYGARFSEATLEQQTALLTKLEAEQDAFFAAIKGLTVTGYYGTEIGIKRELGDNGQSFFLDFKGCTHPEHGAPAKPAKG
jgi:hypothetical protein